MPWYDALCEAAKPCRFMRHFSAKNMAEALKLAEGYHKNFNVTHLPNEYAEKVSPSDASDSENQDIRVGEDETLG